LIAEAASFTFEPAPAVARARRVLIKPLAAYPLPHPVTTSPETIRAIVDGIRRVSDADILLMEGNAEGRAMRPVYQALNYNFPRVLLLDVQDSVAVEVENPLSRPFALPTFWIPNVVLSCDYLITVAPFKVIRGGGCFSIMNLLGLLPATKYQQPGLRALGIHKVVADLFFTVPFDLGVVDARCRFVGDEPTQGTAEAYNKIFLAEPALADRLASEAAGVSTEYLQLIEAAQSEFQQ